MIFAINIYVNQWNFSLLKSGDIEGCKFLRKFMTF
jgi:hypothetical protein